MMLSSLFHRQQSSPASSDRPGYIFLISVLFIGSIAVATVASLLLLGWAAEQNGQTFAQSTQALEMAKSCLELGVQNLREDLNYGGDETITFSPFNSCTLLPIQGSGNSQRVICSEGNAGPTKKRIKMVLVQVFPNAIVSGYEEITDSNDCNPADPVSSSSVSSIGLSSGGSSSIALSSSSNGSSMSGGSSASSTSIASSFGSSSLAGSSDSASSYIALNCGNNVLENPPEQCDDGNLDPNDGCDASCQIPVDCSCTNTPGGNPPSICTCFAS